MTKPTREEVLKFLDDWAIIREDNPEPEFEGWYDAIVSAWQAYLAQEEELKRKNKLIKMQDGFITDKSKIAAERSTQISQLEVELDQLKAENQALKADMEKHENGYGYLLATGQAERGEMRKRNRRETQP